MTAAIDLIALVAELNGDPVPPMADARVDAREVPVREHTRRIRPRTRRASTVSRPAPTAPAAERETPACVPTKAQRAAARQRDYERLEPIALTLAAKVGAAGFTADNLRRAAVNAGVLTGEEGKATGAQRALSWFGPFLSSLARRGVIAPLTYKDGQKVKRVSDRPEAHANAHVVYVLPEFARTVG